MNTASEYDVRFYLGIPGGRAGGTRAGLEGTRGTAPALASPAYWPETGRVGTGGAPNAGEGLRLGGGPGTCPLATGGRLAGGAVAEAARDPGGGLSPRQDGEIASCFQFTTSRSPSIRIDGLVDPRNRPTCGKYYVKAHLLI